MKQKLSHAKGWLLANKLLDELMPYCQRIEIAGSLRRLKSEIGDIELVAIPKFDLDLFGHETGEHLLNSLDWKRFGKIIKAGNKYKQIELHEGINLDLFIVTPPAQWGVQFLIRTGSAEFSHRFVTQKKFGGMLPSCFRVEGGALWANNHIVETPEETDVFRLAGILYLAPEDRH